jgi:O-antigen ligase
MSVWVWIATVVCAVAGGGLAASLSTGYVIVLLALALIVVVFMWRSLDPMVPFLLLIAAMQGGNLLQVSMGDAPIATIMPLLGAWAVLAVLLSWRPDQPARHFSEQGRLLVFSLAALAVIITLTGIVQVWEGDGGQLSLTEILTLIQLAVLVILTVHLLSNPRRLLWVAYVTIAVGAVLSVVALVGRSSALTSAFSAYSYVENGRASGFVGDPNYFSFHLLISLGFSASIGLASKTTRGKLLAWPLFVLILAGIVNTYSAGALVGVAAVLVGTILLQFRVSAKRALTALVLIAVATGVVAALAPPSYRAVVQAKYEGVTSGSFEDFGTGRGAAWEAALRAIASDPVTGVGLGGDRTMRAIADHYTQDLVEYKAAHNMYLGMAVGTGVIGLAVFLVVLASCFHIVWTGHRRASRQNDSEGLAASACMFTALLVIATQGLTISIELEKFTWLIVGACLAIGRWFAEPPEHSAVALPSGESWAAFRDSSVHIDTAETKTWGQVPSASEGADDDPNGN